MKCGTCVNNGNESLGENIKSYLYTFQNVLGRISQKLVANWKYL